MPLPLLDLSPILSGEGGGEKPKSEHFYLPYIK